MAGGVSTLVRLRRGAQAQRLEPHAQHRLAGPADQADHRAQKDVGVATDRAAATANAPAGQRGVSAWLQLTGWIFSVIYAIWALYGMTRPHAREAFESAQSCVSVAWVLTVGRVRLDDRYRRSPMAPYGRESIGWPASLRFL